MWVRFPPGTFTCEEGSKSLKFGTESEQSPEWTAPRRYAVNFCVSGSRRVKSSDRQARTRWRASAQGTVRFA